MPQNLVLEIGTEEMPASAVDLGISQLEEIGRRLLVKNRLTYEKLEVLGTPRRLTLIVNNLAEKQAPVFHEAKGPAQKVAFDEGGNPTAAAAGFARAQGVAVAALQIKETPQGEYVFAVKEEEGKVTTDILPDILKEATLALSFPKSMRWGEGELRFARPIRWLVALYGKETIEFALDNIRSGNLTWGHRFLSPKNPLKITNSQEYPNVLRQGRVIVDHRKRAELIRGQVEKVAALNKSRAVIDPEIFNEVINLVEYPQVVYGTFPSDYLALPREVLITAMEAHQRYFPVEDERGKLKAGFIAVHNGDEKFAEIITKGHERVLQARLADAKFFYEEDQKEPLHQRVERLKGVIFQEKLGTLFEKVERIQALTELIATSVGINQQEKENAKRAAFLCKADLLTNMVVEFPPLQGVMGREYARLSREPEAVATAIYEHYLPRTATDSLPATRIGQVVSIADKLDTIAGCFCLGFLPTGSEDPFSLRRQAQGIISIILENQLPLSFPLLIDNTLKMLAENGVKYSWEKAKGDLEGFFKQRLRQHLLNQGLAYDTLDAVLEEQVDNFVIAQKRAQAINAFRGTEKMLDLITAYTRCKNLSNPEAGLEVDEALLQESEEKDLQTALVKADSALSESMERGDYQKAIEILAGLRPVVDLFFDKVLVMAEDEKVRRNRLALLNKAVEIFSRMADFSKIVEVSDPDKLGST